MSGARTPPVTSTLLGAPATGSPVAGSRWSGTINANGTKGRIAADLGGRPVDQLLQRAVQQRLAAARVDCDLSVLAAGDRDIQFIRQARQKMVALVEQIGARFTASEDSVQLVEIGELTVDLGDRVGQALIQVATQALDLRTGVSRARARNPLSLPAAARPTPADRSPQRLGRFRQGADPVSDPAVGVTGRAEHAILDLPVNLVEGLAATEPALLLANAGVQQLVHRTGGGQGPGAGTPSGNDLRLLLRQLPRIAFGVGVGDVVRGDA